MPKQISLNQARTMGGTIANIELNQACVVTLTSVEERAGRQTGQSYFLCETDAEVLGSAVNIVLNSMGCKIASLTEEMTPRPGLEVVAWCTLSEVTADGKQYYTLYPKGHPKFGVVQNRITATSGSNSEQGY
jgi:hypothetical protein